VTVQADGGDELSESGASAIPTPGGANPTSAATRCTDNIKSSPGVFCENVKDCRKFCDCACDIDYTKWDPKVKDDGSTQCPRAPRTGPGMVAPDSSELGLLADQHFVYIKHRAKERAGPAALEGLKRLDLWLAGAPDREKYGYKVRVVSCYREQLEDTQPECGFVLKSLHMLGKVKTDTDKAYWEKMSDPNNLGLAWPGRTPHSGGYACDLILVDKKGQDSFDARAGVDGAPVSSIKARLASKMLDEAVTNATVGGNRLTFEAWHYEWGSAMGSRCKDPDCSQKYWPVKGTP
jgi:hypothetical protein